MYCINQATVEKFCRFFHLLFQLIVFFGWNIVLFRCVVDSFDWNILFLLSGYWMVFSLRVVHMYYNIFTNNGLGSADEDWMCCTCVMFKH
jgi:hypothetical protein